MQFTIGKILSITQGRLLGNEALTREVSLFCTDSRAVRQAAQSLFIALNTSVRDGHDYISTAYAKGIRIFVINKSDFDITAYPDASFILVGNPLIAMQQIAAAHRMQFDIPIIGITGSNGKTIVKEWLARILAERYQVIKNPKSYNSQIGVPLSVDLIKPYHETGVFEAGISMPNEMLALQNVIKPTVGIFTMVGAAHGANFDSQEQKITEKLVLFKHCKKLFYCLDHAAVHNAVQESFDPSGALQSITWGINPNADLVIQSIEKSNFETKIRLLYQGQIFNWSLPYTDSAYIENAMHCMLYLLDLGFDMEGLQRSFQSIPPVEMRLELLQGIQGCTIINDTYSTDIASLRIALDYLYQQKQHHTHSLILSDILEHHSQEQVYESVFELLKQRPINKLVLIGKGAIHHQDKFKELSASVFSYSDVATFLNEFNISLFQEEAILIKGARAFMLERIVNRLENTIHRTVMQVNLSALVHNVNVFKKKINPATKIMAMVKAFSYGSGSYEIAQTLEHHGVDYLAVAYIDEGIALRRKGIQLPILVLNPEVSSLEAMLHYDLEPEIYSLEMLLQLTQRMQRSNTSLNVHIKFDTGMHRLGIEEKDLPSFTTHLLQAECFVVKSVFSHLVASDDEAHHDFTLAQRDQFLRMANCLEEKLAYPFMRHLANSAGAVSTDNLELDMVRLGIGLYGISSDIKAGQELRQISALTTQVAQVKNVAATDTVGYARAGTLTRDSVIATLNIGYADGYSRSFGNGNGKVRINGQLAPVVGNVCMDMIMVDVTDIQNVKAGQEAIIFDENLSVSALAEWIDTIPYELIAGISQRVRRVYYRE